MTGIGDTFEWLKPERSNHGGPWAEVIGDPYNWDTKQVDYGATYHVNGWGERREDHYAL